MDAAIEIRKFETRLGEIWLAGLPSAFDDDRPLVLVIKGAFAAEYGRYDDLHKVMPEAAVLVAQLPGNFCPPLVATSVGAFIAAFSEVVERAFGHRQVLIWGDSLGGLVALGIPGNLARLVLDPPIRISKTWPVMSNFQDRYRANISEREFLYNVFGVSADGIEQRDYRAVLGLPARVLIGELMEADADDPHFAPSVVGQADREILRRRSEIRLSVVAGVGHLIAGRGPRAAAGLEHRARVADGGAAARGTTLTAIRRRPRISYRVRSWRWRPVPCQVQEPLQRRRGVATPPDQAGLKLRCVAGQIHVAHTCARQVAHRGGHEGDPHARRH